MNTAHASHAIAVGMHVSRDLAHKIRRADRPEQARALQQTKDALDQHLDNLELWLDAAWDASVAGEIRRMLRG